MEKLTAVVLENGDHLHRLLQGFLKDNPHLFGDIRMEIYVGNRTDGEVLQSIAGRDVVLVNSNYETMYRWELFAALFARDEVPGAEHCKFFLFNFLGFLNCWNQDRDSREKLASEFINVFFFLRHIKILVQQNRIYSIHADKQAPRDEYICDEYHEYVHVPPFIRQGVSERLRPPYRYFLVQYDEQADQFTATRP